MHVHKEHSGDQAGNTEFPPRIMDDVDDSMEKKSRISQFTAKFRDPVFKNKFICTLFLFWAFVFLGLVVGLGGPAFLDLMLITNTEVDKASTLFTARAVGSIVGALTSGVLYGKCNKLMLLAVVIVGCSISAGVRPLCTSLPVMIAVTFLGSCCGAGIDTGANADIIRLWGGEEKSYMQILHFCFALGSIFAPLILEPFLAPRFAQAVNTTLGPTNTSDSIVNITSMEYVQSAAGLNESWNQGTSEELESPKSHILIAYLIVSCVGITAAVPFFVEFFLRKVDKNRKPEAEKSRQGQQIPLPVYVVTVSMIGTFFFNYCALEEAFMSFLTVFTVEGLGWTKADGVLIMSVFWGSFALGRFLGIFFINFLAPKKMLLLCLVLLVVSLCAFLLCSIYAVRIGVWVSSIGVGFATSIVFPTAFTWIEEHVIKVTGKVTSVIMMSSSSANIATPILLGYLMQNVTYMSFSYLLFVQSIFVSCLYFVMNIFSSYVLKKYHRPRETDTAKGDTEREHESAGMLS